jgi:hypothetical protein
VYNNQIRPQSSQTFEEPPGIGAASFLLSGNAVRISEDFCDKFNFPWFNKKAKYTRKYFKYEEILPDKGVI